LGGQWIAGLRRHTQQRTQLRYHPSRQTSVWTNRGQHPSAHLGQLALGLGQQQPTQAAKRLKDAVELEITPILVELAGHKPAIVAGHHRA
jgi:hypothetical protein